MKKYKYLYSTLTKILLILVMAFSLAGAGWSVFNLIQFAYLGAIKIVGYILITLLSLLVCTFAFSVLVSGYYTVTDTNLVCKIGFIKSKLPLAEITQAVYYRTENKLVIYFKKDKFAVIVISPDDYEDFVVTLRENNPKIIYDIETTAGENK